MTISIFDDQRQCVREVSQAYKEGHKAVILQMPTGSGKTRTAAHIVEIYMRTNRVVLWLVHQEELLMQAAMTFAEFGIPHRMICAESSERAIKAQEFREFGKSFVDAGATLIIASKPTIVRRLDKLDWLNPDQIIPDEAHLSLADDWRRVLDRWPDARILGLTATPDRLDKKPFHKKDGGIYTAIVRGTPMHVLIEQGRLASYKVWAPPIKFKEGVKVGMKADDFNPNDLELELDDPKIYGDVIEHYRDYSHGLPAIGFCPNVRSANKFANAFVEAGYKAICLEGNTDPRLRRDSLRDLGTGAIDVIFSVGILIQGTDVPYATTALWLCRTTSLTKYLQGTGRVLRAHKLKEYARILDFVGVVAMHGMPDEDREWSLESDSGKRRRAANDNDDLPDVQIMTCPKCHSIHRPAKVCPGCQHVYEVEQRRDMEVVDGKLEELTQEKAAALAEARQRRIMQGQAQTEEDLKKELAKRNIKGRRAETTARKILAAREQKTMLISAVLDGVEEFRAKTGEGPFKMFGVTMGDIQRMKPKALKELLEVIEAKRNPEGGVLQIRSAA